jgi:sortase A
MKRILLICSTFFKSPKRIVFFVAIIIVALLAICATIYYKSKKAGDVVAELPALVENNNIVSEDFTLKIDKLNIVVPIIENVDGADKKVYNQALKNGVAHYKGTALPGEGSNIFIFGHSSTYVGQGGDWGEIFKDLNNLESGDIISITFKGKEYFYKVVEKKIIKKTDVAVLNPTESEQLVLMTCWPIGTNKDRLIIIAKP